MARAYQFQLGGPVDGEWHRVLGQRRSGGGMRDVKYSILFRPGSSLSVGKVCKRLAAAGEKATLAAGPVHVGSAE
jgi:hypothetical protein